MRADIIACKVQLLNMLIDDVQGHPAERVALVAAWAATDYETRATATEQAIKNALRDFGIEPTEH